MAAPVRVRRGETEAHRRLKRAAVLWAQAQGYAACALEVSLPQCRYRADLAAYRPAKDSPGVTAIFECKQALADLRRDNCRTISARERLESISSRRRVLEKHLRVHYPTLRSGDSLFPEFESHDFAAINHRNYARVLRELTALQKRIHQGVKFECLMQYRCANLFYLVLPHGLFREPEIPIGWGVLIESSGVLSLLRKPVWQENAAHTPLRFLQRIAAAGTRHLNRQLEISFEEVRLARGML